MYFPGSQTYCAPSQIQWPGSHEYPGNGGGAFSASGAGGGVVTMASGDGGGPRSPACAIISPGSAAGLALLASADEAKPGNIFTIDGQSPHFPSATDHFPDVQTNVVPLHVSMGAYNSMQQSDAHSYWEFNYQGTNWVHPLYELPFTGGFPDNFGQAPDAFQDGEIGKLQSIVPGSSRKSGLHRTPRWRGRDSNCWSPVKCDGAL
jgi:hypothetical protein